MSKVKVVITDSSFPSDKPEREVLEKAGAEVFRYNYFTEDEIIEVARDAVGLLVQLAPITRRVIENLEGVKVISRYGIGVDNIDLAAATEKGIMVANIIYDTEDVADHTVTLLLSIYRKIPSIDRDTKAGIWDWKRYIPIYRMKDSVVGIIGLGRIGRMVAKRLKAFGAHIIGYDPYLPDDVFAREEVERVSLEELLKKSNIITLHVPLTEETHHLIGEEQFKIMKEGAYLVNASRGAVVDEKALIKALEEGRLGGAALDVLEKEPVKPDNPLTKMGNVIISPHMGFYSEQVVLEIQRKTAENVASVLRGEIPRYLVNKEVLEKIGR